MPVRTNQEGNESSKSICVHKKLEVVETAALRQQEPNIKATAITQFQHCVVTLEYEPSIIRAFSFKRSYNFKKKKKLNLSNKLKQKNSPAGLNQPAGSRHCRKGCLDDRSYYSQIIHHLLKIQLYCYKQVLISQVQIKERIRGISIRGISI